MIYTSPSKILRERITTNYSYVITNVLQKIYKMGQNMIVENGREGQNKKK